MTSVERSRGAVCDPKIDLGGRSSFSTKRKRTHANVILSGVDGNHFLEVVMLKGSMMPRRSSTVEHLC